MERSENNDKLLEQQTIDGLKAHLAGKMTELGTEFLTRANSLVENLKSETGLSHAELTKYKLYHVLAGSSFLPENSPYFDLPDGKIKKLIESF